MDNKLEQIKEIELTEIEPLFSGQLQKNNNLFIADEFGIVELFPTLDLLRKDSFPFEVYCRLGRDKNELIPFIVEQYPEVILINEDFKQEMYALLSKQKIGSRLYLLGEDRMVTSLKQLAEENGFGEDEIITKVYGPKEYSILCARCANFTKSLTKNGVICEHCYTPMRVSKHFSRRLQAYFGYAR